MSKKAKGKKAKKERKDRNAAVVKQCVRYMQSLAAWRAGFTADPDGDGKTAEPLADYQIKCSKKALVKLARMRATTAEAVQAKALIVSPMIEDNREVGNLEEEEEAFLSSFAADVKVFLQTIIDENWRASHTSNDAAAPQPTT
jgi:hypothetical protein